MAGPNLLLQDALLIVTGAYPAAAATAATSFIDLGEGPKDQFNPQRVLFQLQVPALTPTQLPNSTNAIYQIMSTDSATTNAASAYCVMIVPTLGDNAVNTVSNQTFANASSGAAGFNYTFALPFSVRRYLFAQATASASTVATTATLTLTALF